MSNNTITDGTTTFKVRNITELIKNLEDLQTKNTQLEAKLIELTAVQPVNVSFDSTYVGQVEVYKTGYIVHGYCSFYKSAGDPNIPIITNLPRPASGWGAVVTPLHAHSTDGQFIRVHMEAGETVLHLHYSTSWQATQGNEAELAFTYITID